MLGKREEVRQGGEIRKVFLQVSRMERRCRQKMTRLCQLVLIFTLFFFGGRKAGFRGFRYPHFEKKLIDSHEKSRFLLNTRESAIRCSSRLRDPFIFANRCSLQSNFLTDTVLRLPPNMSRPEDTLYVATTPP